MYNTNTGQFRTVFNGFD